MPFAASIGPLQVVHQLLRMLETSGRAAQPRSAEAQRVLSFFISSLKNPTLVRDRWYCSSTALHCQQRLRH